MKKIFLNIVILVLGVFFSPHILFGLGASSSVSMIDADKLGEKENELDNNITAIILAPTPFKQDKTKGISADFNLFNVIGEITGTRKGSGKQEYTNPVLMSFVSLSAKYTINQEKPKIPAIAAGALYTLAIDLGNQMSSEIDYKDFSRPSSAYGVFASFGKTLINDNTRVVCGYIFGNYSKMFSNMAQYYYPEEANIIFTGIDLNLNKFRMYFEILKPLDGKQNPLIVNFRIKKFVPTLALTYMTTGGYAGEGIKYKGGSSLIASINLRIPVYPPISESDINEIRLKKEEKERFKEMQKKVKDLEL
ncbi:MAG TPA: hypothetical protein PKY81_02960 [bacterium]|nr:hypothetical protein [bacterium]HPN29897.1 hypothetical protein [bacterium]